MAFMGERRWAQLSIGLANYSGLKVLELGARTIESTALSRDLCGAKGSAGPDYRGVVAAG